MRILRTVIASSVVVVVGCQEPEIGDAPPLDASAATSSDAAPMRSDAAPKQPDAAPTRPDAAPKQPDAAPSPGPDAQPDSGPVAVTLSQNASEEILANHSVACRVDDGTGNPVQNLENSYYRAFTLADQGIAGDFSVSSVRFGVESATTRDGAAQPASVRLHTLAGELLVANLTEIAAIDIEVAPANQTFIDVPIQADVPAGSTLVVELFIPASTVGQLFFIGMNDLSETAPSFVRAPSCRVPEPRTFAAIDFPDRHIIMTVSGSHF